MKRPLPWHLAPDSRRGAGHPDGTAGTYAREQLDYSTVHGLKFRDDMWKTYACRGEGNKVVAYVDLKTRQAFPGAQVSRPS
ncbi:hypothetical protein [Dyella sp.]|uniref:hypothetical protein n=1 Tax=Dyella sp. TaxID=1869338 RepID=UPI002ED4BE43